MGSQNVQLANKSQKLFLKINSFTCIAGFLNFWGDSRLEPKIIKTTYYKLLFKFTSLCSYVLMVLEISAFFKRDQLNMKQKYDWIVLALSHPILYSFFLGVRRHKEKIKNLLLCLTVHLKEVYSDRNIEESMLNRAKCYIAAYVFFCSTTLLLYGIDGVLQVITLDKSFTTLITVWPDLEDKSLVATFAGIAIYLTWWVVMARSSTAYITAIVTTVCLSHQFKNLQIYFYGLEDIFNEEDLTQAQKEEKYEKAFKVGIKLHSDTLWCCQQCQTIFNLVYSGQSIINLTALVILMLQMVNSERTTLNALAIVAIASALLVTTGVFMWNAGDVTVEASNLATAMYSSGWQRCSRAASVRVRKLLVVAMTQAQQPVMLRACGIMELSHRSYLTIVKSSYSVFSLIY